jgi:hypothetical protein
VWRRDEDADQAFALKLTAAGLKAIAGEANEDEGKAATTREHNEEADNEPQIIKSPRPALAQDAQIGAIASRPIAPRAGTKIADVVRMLEGGSGAAIDDIIAATQWLPHTARAALAGLRKRGYSITCDRSDRTRSTVYRIARTGRSGDVSDAAATEVGGGDSDDSTAANPPATTARKPATRTRRAA